MWLLNRNLLLLCFGQLIFSSGSVALVTLGGIIGTQLAAKAELATLPMSLMVIGTAFAAIPAALTMQRIGRRYGFALGAAIGSSSALLTVLALDQASFALFSLGAFGIGMTLAFGQQFRFAAAESVTPDRVSFAVSFILLGSIGGAFIGPALASHSPTVDPASPYRFAMLGSAGLFFCAALALLALRNVVVEQANDSAAPARPLGEIVRQPLFAVAVLGGLIGQGVMVYIMTATPLSMHVVDGHSLSDTADVIRAHVLAMFLPSLVTGPLIAWLGARRLMAAGACSMLIALALGLQGHQVMHYWGTLVLIGVGWNFLFIGGTTLLVRTYRPAERFRAQAVNDFTVFAGSAAASLLAGTLMFQLGWTTVLFTAAPLLVGALGVLWWSIRSTNTNAAEPASA